MNSDPVITSKTSRTTLKTHEHLFIAGTFGDANLMGQFHRDNESDRCVHFSNKYQQQIRKVLDGASKDVL